MHLFKFYKKQYCLVHPELIKSLIIAIRTTSEYCMFINNIEKFSYIKDVTKDDMNVLNEINTQLVRLNILNKQKNGFVPRNRYYPMISVFNKTNKKDLNGIEFRKICNETHEQFKKQFNTVKQKSINNKPKVIKKPLNDRDYNPAYHETYAYSDANWSPKDASL